MFDAESPIEHSSEELDNSLFFAVPSACQVVDALPHDQIRVVGLLERDRPANDVLFLLGDEQISVRDLQLFQRED
ncbi:MULTISPECIES: hypothetical protein [unclassified Streptomyces]|uniref:hypothetical protein n=1 Tax=unclassified Streptomyces TaxID=2593676 RepID=UPI00225B1CE4|nr:MULTISPECIES: hypothetical protein [unclassified Streptomyces]MCX4792925.1 hypothetical protein [Streptomyces sp. NBC_01242]WSP59576.1 hypothetical protein OG306_38360 [Streptomyces sp. NBC_01241]WSP60828.1 hypothetical protein OG466_02075 [Streptomyces sp. NBC_01240]WSU19908.1 hypothetical protein OG508_02025 [Streptomyces sp. NBC_01108]